MKHLGDDFKNVIWTDESSIQMENHRTFCYRKIGEPPKPKPKPKHAYKVMVWAGISMEGATRLVIIDTLINSDVYQDILRTHLLPFLEKMPNHRFKQDNAPCQRSASTKAFFQEHEITLLKHHQSHQTSIP